MKGCLSPILKGRLMVSAVSGPQGEQVTPAIDSIEILVDGIRRFLKQKWNNWSELKMLVIYI